MSGPQPGLGTGHRGLSLEELRFNVKDAIECHFDEIKPRMIHLHFVHDKILSYA
jgi:hypothetical protein